MTSLFSPIPPAAIPLLPWLRAQGSDGATVAEMVAQFGDGARDEAARLLMTGEIRRGNVWRGCNRVMTAA